MSTISDSRSPPGAICRLDWDGESVSWHFARFRAVEPERSGIIAAVAAGEEHRRSLLVHTLSSSSRLVGATALAEAARQFPGEVDEAGLRSTAAGVGAALRRWLSP